MKLKDLMKKYGDYEVTGIFDNDGDKLDGYVNVGLKRSEPKSVWELKDGDKCYYVDEFGNIKDTGGYLRPLSEAIENGNVSLTEEEASREVERRRVETLLLKHGGRRWFKTDGDNFYLVKENYDFETYQAYCILPLGEIYFDTEEEAQKAVKEIGAERIKQALFEVR